MFLEHRKPSVSKSTLQNAKTRLKAFLEWCEHEDIENLNDLNGRRLHQFTRWRQDQVAAITLQKQLSTIRMFLEWCANVEAVEQGLREKVVAPELPDGAEAREVKLSAERATFILSQLDRYDFASRRHVILALLWRTGMRRGALQSLDVDDLRPEDHVIELVHRPETDTPLKNGEAGERWVYLGPIWYSVVDEYVKHPDRRSVTDDHGREPLITTRFGRASQETIYDTVHRATQPCQYGECPHDRVPDECEAVGTENTPSKCPSSVSPPRGPARETNPRPQKRRPAGSRVRASRRLARRAVQTLRRPRPARENGRQKTLLRGIMTRSSYNHGPNLN